MDDGEMVRENDRPAALVRERERILIRDEADAVVAGRAVDEQLRAPRGDGLREVQRGAGEERAPFKRFQPRRCQGVDVAPPLS